MTKFIQKKEQELLAINNEKPIGKIIYNYKQCSILYLFIDNAHRRNYIASNLLEKAEKELKKAGCKNSYLISNKLNYNFYIKNNYAWQNPYLRYLLISPYHMVKEL